MNRSRSILALSTALLFLFETLAGASDVTLYSVYKRQLYFQFGAGSPTPPSVEDFRFFSLVQITSSTNASSASVTPPGGSGQALSTNFNNSPYPPQFSLSSTSYTSQAALDGAWPNGIYFYDIATANDGVKRLQLSLTGNNYPVAPHISNYASAQGIIASAAFTLTWDAMTGGTTNDYIQLEVNTGNTVIFFSPLPPVVGALDGTATSVVIPANLLAPSTTYTARLRFFKATTRESTSYPGALAAAAYNRDTIFNLTTVATPGAPTITQQPISQTQVVGNSATFSVTGTGTAPLTYQWRKDGTNLAGATNSSYTVANVQASHAGGYTVMVSDSGATSTSVNATLTVNLLNAPVEVGTVLAWGQNQAGQTTVPAGLSRVIAVTAGQSHTLALKSDGTVVAWGDNSYGQTTVPAGLSGVTAIAAGRYNTVVLKSDGTVATWGYRSGFPAGLNVITAIAAGRYHTLALKSDGTVVAWGSNIYGQTTVPVGLSGVTAIAGGGFHSVALKSDGTVVAWGANGYDYGQTTVPAGLSGVVAIAAGYDHTVALKSDGTVVAWGANGVPPGLSGVTAIAAGQSHSLALKSDGTVVALGNNYSGQTAVPAGLSGVTAIAVGDSHAVVVGVAPPSITTQPQSQSVGAGADVTLSVAATGTVPMGFQWRKDGTNLAGATGSAYTIGNVQTNHAGSYAVIISNVAGSVTSAPPAVLTVALTPTIAQQPVTLTALVGQTRTFTATVNGAAPLTYQWRKDGVNLAGATSATLTLSNVLTNRTGSYALVVTNAYGSVTSSVVVLTVNRLPQTVSFGSLPAKRLDDAPFTLSATSSSGLPVSYASFNPSVVTVSGNTVAITGFGTTIITASQVGDATYLPSSVGQALRVAMPGTVVAWGANGVDYYGISYNRGQITVPAGLSGVVDIAAGDGHTVALKSDGSAVAWGWNAYSQSTIPAGLNGVTAIAAGWYHTVALKSDGTVVAWGLYGYGATGVPAGLSGVMAIAAGRDFTVALKNDGTVLAWGAGTTATGVGLEFGQSMVPVGLSGVMAIAAGHAHTVALKSDGTVVAWGDNRQGQTNVSVGLSGVTAIAAGGYHTVALKSDGTVVARGYNFYGQTTVPAGLSGVVAIAAGYDHTVALKSDGTVVAWGSDTEDQSSVPVGLSGVMAVEAGGHHTVALVPEFPMLMMQPASVTVNVTSNATFTASVSGTTPFSYLWRKGGTSLIGGTNSSYSIANAQTSHTGAYTVEVSNSFGSVTSSPPAILTVNTPPTLTIQPQNQAVVVGDDVTFNVTASGTASFSYLWRKDGTNLVGATNSSYSIANAQTNHGGGYTVIVSNFLGSVTSAPPAVLVVNVPPAITSQPANQTVVVGNTATFNVTATGTAPLTYQWRKDGTNLNGITGSSYTIPSVQASHAGSYAVVVSNVAGSVTSAPPAMLTVNVPSSITQQPMDQVVVAGASATFSVTTSGTAPLTYQWRKDGTNLTGATSSNYSIAITQPNHVGAYTVVVSNSFGSVTSAPPAVLTLNTPPTAAQQPQSQTVVAGTTATFSVTATGTAPFNYQWRKDGTNLTGAAGSNYSIANTQTNHAGGYTVVVSNSFGSITSSPPAVLTVNLPPTITLQPVSQTILAGAAVTFSVTASGTAPFTYQWRKDGTNLAGATSSSYALARVQLGHAGGYSVMVSNVAGSVTSSTATLTLNFGTVLAWVRNVEGQTNVPVGLNGVVAVAGGGYHNLALKADGTVTAWGHNDKGQSSVPVPAQSGVGAIAGGGFHSLAIKGDGTVVAWGRNVEGQTNVPAGLVGAVAVSGGAFHSLALLSNGTVAAWGRNDQGQGSVPVGLTGVTAVAGGGYHNLALKTNGTVFAWGFNGNGETNVPSALSGAIAVSGGGYHSVALKSDGTVVAWGRNVEGQTNVPVGLSGVVAVSAGFSHNLALKSDGTVVVWGLNNFGQGTVPTGLSGVMALSAGYYHNLALVPAPSPSIPTSPLSLAVNATSNATFSVTPTGSGPFSYQWMKDRVLIAGQTNAQLNLSDLTNRARGGNFTVMVSNLYGAITGNIGSLRVRVPHRLQPPVATNGMFRLLSADQDGGLLITNDLAYFSVQSSTNLAATNWLSFTYTNGLTLTNGMLRLDDTNAANRPFRYYRVIEQ